MLMQGSEEIATDATDYRNYDAGCVCVLQGVCVMQGASLVIWVQRCRWVAGSVFPAIEPRNSYGLPAPDMSTATISGDYGED